MIETVVKRVLHHIAARWEEDSQRKPERECVFQNMRRTGGLTSDANQIRNMAAVQSVSVQ